MKIEKKWRAFQINMGTDVLQIGRWRIIWGMDIWLGNVPFMKTLLLANIIVWVLMIK